MKKGSVGHAFLFLALAVLISSPFVFAGFSDWWGSITGRLTQNTTDVSVLVGNTAPVVFAVYNGSLGDVDPTAGTVTAITFTFNVSDADGVANLDDTSAKGNVTYAGITRQNNSCVQQIDYATANTVLYHCTIELYYYDPAGTWQINASIDDVNSAHDENTSALMIYNALHSVNFTDSDGAPLSLTWTGLSATSTNQGSSNDPITITNEGNEEDLDFNVTAKHLQGNITTTEYIYADNFSVSGTSEGCGGVELQNATSINITSVQLGRTQGSAQQEQSYFCIEGLDPTISAQEYNTTAYGAWTVETVAQ